MAEVKTRQTYSVELSEKECGQLWILLDAGVEWDTIKTLGLDSLYLALSDIPDFSKAASIFQSKAELY